MKFWCCDAEINTLPILDFHNMPRGAQEFPNEEDIGIDFRVDTVILMSSASFLVEDIMYSIRREHPSVQNVIFIGDLADVEFSLKKHNLLQQKD